MAIILALVNLEANSISETILMFAFLIFLITAALSGIPGLLIISDF